jgi:hypothetical protein
MYLPMTKLTQRLQIDRIITATSILTDDVMH